MGNMVILTITDYGDESVGLRGQSWEIQCPLQRDDDHEMFEDFRKSAIAIFSEFTDGNIDAIYDYEWKVITEHENLAFPKK